MLVNVHDEQAQVVDDPKAKNGKLSKTGKSRSPSAKKRGENSKSPKAKGKGGKNQKEEPAPIGKPKKLGFFFKSKNYS